MPFRRYAIAGLADRPGWWLVRPEEITEACRDLKQGEVQEIAVTAGGFPVNAVSFGGKRARTGTATWASGSNSRNPHSYKPNPEGMQVIVLVCGVHGAEAEAVAGAVNLVSLLETGRDMRKLQRPKLAELAQHYRIVILPCVNMDGRALSPDHLRGASEEEFRKASQGLWKDGSSIGYPECKEYAPLPLERVGHPGGYPNAQGYNIMQYIFPGDMKTMEAKAILKLMADEQADLILHMHSHGIGAVVLPPSILSYPLHVARTQLYQKRIFDALEKANLRPGTVHGSGARTGINLNTAAAIACGGFSLCFEQPAVADWTFDEMLETFYVALETFLSWGQKEPFSPRDRIYEA